MTKSLTIIFIFLLALSPKLHAQNKGVIFTAKATNGAYHSAHLMCPEQALKTLLSTNLWQPVTYVGVPTTWEPANIKNHYEYKNLFADVGYHKFISSIIDQAIQLGCTQGTL